MKSLIAIILLGVATLSTATAAENGGLLVDVQKISLERHDGRQGMLNTIDRTMTLKINVQNNSMKEVPETTLDYVIVIQRWGMELSRFERTEGQLKMEKLKPSFSTTLNAGEIRIGGHMHGTSDRHVDHIAGWKVTIVRDGQKVDFTSAPNFDALNNRVGK